MQRRIRTRRFWLSVALCAGASAAAIAQTMPAAAAAPGGGQSVWSIIFAGIEWPAWFILIGSVVTLSLIVEQFVTTRLVTIAPANQVKTAKSMIERRAFKECVESMRGSRTYFARVMSASLAHARHGFDAMHEAALEKAGEIGGQMYRKVEYLNILGNLGPLLGLLGTVYGMIIAFGELGQGGGQAGAGDLARGISLALVNTLLGLGLAIVGLLFFGVCRNRIEALTVHATVEVLDLLEYFRPVASGAGSAAPAARAPQATTPAS